MLVEAYASAGFGFPLHRQASIGSPWTSSKRRTRARTCPLSVSSHSLAIDAKMAERGCVRHPTTLDFCPVRLPVIFPPASHRPWLFRDTPSPDLT